MYPNGEVADPYVFVLANPQILPVKLPMNGKLKICKNQNLNPTPTSSDEKVRNVTVSFLISDKLEQHVHQAAKRALDKKSS